MTTTAERPVCCPTCDGHGALTMDEALALRGSEMDFMADSEDLDYLIVAAGGPALYTDRCPRDNHRCLYVHDDPAKVRARNERYASYGLTAAMACCRGEQP